MKDKKQKQIEIEINPIKELERYYGEKDLKKELNKYKFSTSYWDSLWAFYKKNGTKKTMDVAMNMAFKSPGREYRGYLIDYLYLKQAKENEKAAMAMAIAGCIRKEFGPDTVMFAPDVTMVVKENYFDY